MLPYKGPPATWKDPGHWLGLLRRWPGVFWQHDGNPLRPYALMTNGQISDTYINFSKLPPRAASEFMHYLAHLIKGRIWDNSVIIGQADGSTVLAFDLAKHLGRPYGFTRKWQRGKRVVAVRCRGNFFPTSQLVFLDDVYRSGSTLNQARAACERLGYPNLSPFDVVAVHRVEEGHKPVRLTISAVQVTTRSWNLGENPHTPNGQELVRPVRPKGRGWERLTRKY